MLCLSLFAYYFSNIANLTLSECVTANLLSFKIDCFTSIYVYIVYIFHNIAAIDTSVLHILHKAKIAIFDLTYFTVCGKIEKRTGKGWERYDQNPEWNS